MKRKLIQLSPSTAVVSLPSKWIEKNKLKKGTDLDVEEVENRIIIKAESKKTASDITIDISDLYDRQVWHYMDAAYIAGYDLITIITRDETQTALMSKAVKTFPGMIIYDERIGRVQFKDITGDAKEDQDKIIGRIFNMNISLLEDSLTAIKEKNWEVLTKMKKRDYHINSYISYCLRQINKFGYKKFSKTGLISTYLKIIEMISDKLSNLMEDIGKKKFKDDEMVSIVSQLLDIYRLIQSLHLGYSKARLLLLEEKRTKLVKHAEKSDGETKIHLSEITSILSDLEQVEIQLNL